MDVNAIADELSQAYASRRMLAEPLSAREGLDLATAYAVESELTRRRRASGRTTVGLKVGYANKAVWRALKLETLVWAHMYDDTVVHAGSTARAPYGLSIGRMCSPRLEPEIVFRLARAVEPGTQDPALILASVEWLALGFEIVDSVFADWKFQPADFVAAYGLHAALVIGEPRPVTPDAIPSLVDQLAQFRLRLSRNGDPVAEGSGRNSLRSPALCLGELASAVARRHPGAALGPGALVSSGTLTDAQPIGTDDTWTARVEGLELDELAVHTIL